MLRVEGFDWNCPQYITPRYTEEEVRKWTEPLERKLENRELRLRVAAMEDPSTTRK
jgi:uncharacterized protein